MLTANLLQKFYVTIADADIGSLESLHTLLVYLISLLLVGFPTFGISRKINSYRPSTDRIRSRFSGKLNVPVTKSVAIVFNFFLFYLKKKS